MTKAGLKEMEATVETGLEEKRARLDASMKNWTRWTPPGMSV
jgi:hypothetical protein